MLLGSIIGAVVGILLELLGSIIGAVVGILLELLALLLVALVPGMTAPSSLSCLPPLGVLLGIVLALLLFAISGVSMLHDDRRRRAITSRRPRSWLRLDRLPGPLRLVLTYINSLLGLFLMICFIIALFLVNKLHDLQD